MAGGNKGIHDFPKSISLNMSVIVRLELELSYYDSTVQFVSHYASWTHKKELKSYNCKQIYVSRIIIWSYVYKLFQFS